MVGKCCFSPGSGSPRQCGLSWLGRGWLGCSTCCLLVVRKILVVVFVIRRRSLLGKEGGNLYSARSLSFYIEFNAYQNTKRVPVLSIVSTFDY